MSIVTDTISERILQAKTLPQSLYVGSTKTVTTKDTQMASGYARFRWGEAIFFLIISPIKSAQVGNIVIYLRYRLLIVDSPWNDNHLVMILHQGRYYVPEKVLSNDEIQECFNNIFARYLS